MKEYKLNINGNDYQVAVNDLNGNRADVTVNGTNYTVTLDQEKAVAAKPVAIKVAVGDAVKVGQRLMVLEAMKMENNVDSDKEGTVAEIRVGTGDSVLEGDVLIVIE